MTFQTPKMKAIPHVGRKLPEFAQQGRKLFYTLIEDMSVKDRLIEFIEHLNTNPKSFERTYGFANGFVRNIGFSISQKSIDKLKAAFPNLNINYILTGDGGLLKDIEQKEQEFNEDRIPYNAVPVKYKKTENNNIIAPKPTIPMYNFPGSASDIEMYSDPNEVKIIGYLNIPGAIKGSFALPVHGHSMYPTLENGSWCVLRDISDKSDIYWGEIYYIEHGDYRQFKRLLQADNEDSVILWSDNQSEIINNKPKYAPKTIKLESINRLCLLTDILKKPNY